MRVISAMFAGRCPAGHDDIRPGQKLAQDRAGRWGHIACVAAAGALAEHKGRLEAGETFSSTRRPYVRKPRRPGGPSTT